MPRTARKQSSTGILHVMLRGIDRQRIFREDADCMHFLEVLKICKELSGFELHAYCLMGNHVHLLIWPGNESAAQIVKRIGCRYVPWFNHKYGRAGHLFQDRYRSEAIEDDGYYLTALRYIIQNPLKAGLEARVGEYRWTSFSAYAGREDGLTDTAFAASYFDGGEELVNWLTARADDQAMDVSPFEANVESLRQWLRELSGCEDVQAFRTAGREKRLLTVRGLRARGATVRQIAEVTGLSRSAVGRMIGEDE